MAYNRWLAHHGVKGQKWGERNGPPYPLNSSISDGHKLIKSDGSPQSKKKYKTSEKTAHKRAERKARTNRELERARKLYGKDDVSEAEIIALRRAKRDIESHHVVDPELQELITMDQMDHADVENYSVWDEIFEGHVGASLKPTKTIFVSGSSKTQDEASGYYRKELPKDIQKQLDEHMRKGNRIIVGDAPGIDRQVQDYLNSKKYRNVEVYGPGKEVRYTANSKWKTNPIDDPDHEPGSKEWLAKKDIAMTEAADEGLAIVLDEGAKATRKNVQRLNESGKGVRVYSLNKDGNDSWEDDWDRKWNTSYASKNVKKANDIYKTLSKQEKYFLTAEENSKRYVSREEYGKKGTNAYSLIEQYKDTPVSVIDIWKNDRGGADVSIAVRNNSKYRHKGYASRALENGLKYFYDHPEIEYLIWGVNSQNRPSIELAKKYGFYLYDKRDDGWETYTLDQKKEVKHAMAYNRWMYSDELYHHGVKGQKWGERNGPPYPLDSSLSDGSKLLPKATGSPQTKKKYKTSEKTAYQRKKRQEKIESSPDYQEKHSVGAELKRKYRAYKKEQKSKQEAAEEKRANDEKAWSEAADRLNKSSIPWEERKKILEEIAESDYSMYNSGRYATHPVWGNRPDRGLDADKLNKAIDDYESKQAAARDAAKEHGTAEEVMKFRDTFSKEEWDSIASRLESEARVRKLLDKPLQSFDSGGNKQNQNSSNSSNQSKAVNAPENSKLKKIYEKGTAREVYQNRDKFTVEQLEAVEKRLTAEEKIGKLANNQVFITPDRVKKLEQVRDLLGVVGGIANNANAISKAFGGGNNNNNNNNNNNSGSGNSGGKKKAKINKAKNSSASSGSSSSSSDSRSSESASSTSSSSSDSRRTAVSDWIDKLSEVGKVATDETHVGKINPLERVGRVFTDEERKKR